MMLASLIAGGVLIGMGALILWLARKGELGTLKRNPVVGVRTALTMSSDSVWYPAQRAAVPKTRVAGWGSVVGGVAAATLGLWPLAVDTSVFILLILIFGSAAWFMAWALAAAASAQRAAVAAVNNSR